MIQSVQIKNLRGIREGELTGLSPLSILVGPNGCGKSTVLDALLIGASPVPTEAIGRTVARRKAPPESARWLIWRADESLNIQIHVTTSSGKRTGRLEFGRPASSATPQGNNAERSAASGHTTPSPREVASIRCWIFPAPTSPTRSTEVTFDAENHYEYERGLQFPKVVPDARIVEAYAHEVVPLHKLYTKVVEQGRRREAGALISELLPDVCDIEILTAGDTPVIHLVYDTHSVPAEFAGDGIHALLRLVLELASTSGGVVLLEEPESHQHPGAIRQSARAILAAVRRDVQVILTTHSLELIDILLAEAQPDDLAKLSLHRINLNDGTLLTARLAGEEVALARREIEDDLR